MERSEVEAKYKWKAEDIFPSDEAWEEQYAAAASLPLPARVGGQAA